jgi:Mg2+-importing ATPase
LLCATLAVGLLALLLPFTGAANALGFGPLSGKVVAFVLLVAVAYALTAEWIKRVFYRTVPLD